MSWQSFNQIAWRKKYNKSIDRYSSNVNSVVWVGSPHPGYLASSHFLEDYGESLGHSKRNSQICGDLLVSGPATLKRDWLTSTEKNGSCSYGPNAISVADPRAIELNFGTES